MAAHVKSKFPEMTLPQVTLTEFLFSDMKHPDKPAYIDAVSGKQYTFGEFKSNLRVVGSALSRLDFKPREAVMLFSTNCIDYPLLFHSVIAVGGISTLCNPLYKAEELLHQMEDGEPVIIATERAFLPVIREAMKKYHNIRHILLFDEASSEGEEEEEGCIPFSKLLQDDGTLFPDDVTHDLDDVVMMPYSSGTTGRAKGVLHSHRTLTAGIAILGHEFISPMPDLDDIALCAVPMYHILGLGIYSVLSIHRNITVILLKRFTPQGFLQAIDDYKVTSLFIVPPIAVFLSKHPVVDQYNLSSIRLCFSAAAPLGKEVMEECKRRLKFDNFRQLYGMTEVLATHGTPRTDHVAGSVGILTANNEVKICHLDTGDVCDVHEDGEIYLRGPQIMLGYNKRPDETARTINNEGWLLTGDIGHLDEDGNLFIVDRLKELIKYNAYQVPPAELENLLLQHPAVADSAVIGVPDPAAGELPRAFIVLKAGEQVTGEQLQDYIAERVAPQKKLRGGVVFVSEIPKSPSGKILRRILKERVKAEQAEQAKQAEQAEQAEQAKENGQ